MLHYCVICGVHISRTSASPGAVPTEDLEWYQQLRVVQGNDSTDLDGVSLSGVGFLNSLHQIIVPLDRLSSFKNSANADHLVSYVPTYDPELRTWCFTFHALCWEILLERVPEGLSDITRFSTSFFQTLLCTRWDRFRSIFPGHDYGGAARFWSAVGNPNSSMTVQGFAHLLGCPSQYRDVSEILSSVPQNTRRCTHRPAGIALSNYCSEYDALSSLPAEILFMILSLLPSSDVQRLRLASKYVAFKTDPASLPRSFWRSRFRPDFEMDFALPIDTSANQNWGDAYFWLKEALGNNSGSARTRNRHRIWKLAGLNSHLLAQHMTIVGPHGSPLQATSPRVCTIGEDLSPGEIIRTESFVDDRGLLRSGSRKLHDRGIILPFDKSTITGILIYTVSFNGQESISGLQFEIVDPSTQTSTAFTLGFISTASQLVNISSSCVAGLEVVACARGITGIRVDLDNHCYDPRPPWVGDIGNGEADIGFGKLKFGQKAGQQTRLVATFDAFKMTSLGVTEGGGSLDGIITDRLAAQSLWTPSYPRETATLVPKPKAQYHCHDFDPTLLNLDFGGPNGERLGKLTRIVMHVHNRLSPFVGATFYFNDETFIHFGRQGLMEISSFIDGPGGELISSVMVEKSVENDRVVSCLLRTNFGNQLTFSCDELKYSQVIEQRPELSYHSPELTPLSPNPYIKEEKMIQTLEAPAGQWITGFCAVFDAKEYSFVNFGLQCENIPKQRSGVIIEREDFTSPSSSACLASSLGSYVMGELSNGWRAYTSADLQSVSRIRFSSGNPARPRRQGDVSGLWFDYYNRPQPSIIGQWLSESASMSIEDGEIISEITIWLSEVKKPFSERYYMGRIARISISTSLRTVSFPDEAPSLSTDELVVVRSQGNRLEELSTLVWVFNSVWDFIRVVSSPKYPKGKLTCRDPRSFLKARPWAAPQRALWEGGTTTDKLVSITAYHGSDNPDRITGLTFTYLSGYCGEIGSISTHRTQNSLIFGADEKIEKVELLTELDYLSGMAISCRKESNGEARNHVLGDTTPARTDRGLMDGQEIDIRQRRLTARYGEDTECSQLQGAAAGIWGIEVPEERLVVGFVVLEDS